MYSIAALTFLLTRPLRDVTTHARCRLLSRLISTHTPLAGRDFRPLKIFAIPESFLLTRPLRDVTKRLDGADLDIRFLLTRPLRDVT